MNSLIFHSAFIKTLDEIAENINEHKPKEVYLISEQEWEWPFNQHLMDAVRNVDKVNYILGSFDSIWYKEFCDKNNLNNFNFTFWSTYFFNWGELCLKNEFDYLKVDNSNFTIPFINYNGNPHTHRCHLVDNLAKHKLLDKGVVSWNIKSNNFNFKHFDNNLRLRDNYTTILHSYIITQEYQNTFIECIGEATHFVPFITEKTVRPLLMKKPFFVLGCYQYSDYLKKLGFELYDEIIDYSYDQISDLELRSEQFVLNLNNILRETDYNFLYKKLYKKIEHNFHNTLKIVNDKTLIPEFLLQTEINRPYKLLFDRIVN